MPKKIIPLRKYFALKRQQEQKQQQNSTNHQQNAMEETKRMDSNAIHDNNNTNNSTKLENNNSNQQINKNKRKNVSDNIDDSEYWKSIEKNQNKRKLQQEYAMDSDSNSESEDEDGIDLEGNLEDNGVLENYTFEFNDMKEDYAEGICMMLKNHSFIANPTDAYQLALMITSQRTVVTTEEGQDSFAFATVLSISKCNKIKPLQAIIQCLLNCINDNSSMNHSKHHNNSISNKDQSSIQLFTDCLIGKYSQQTALLIHKRFANLPLELIGTLHQNLEEDIQWAKTQSSDSDNDDDNSADSVLSHNFFIDFNYILIFCECHLLHQSSTTTNKSKGLGKLGKVAENKDNSGKGYYLFPDTTSYYNLLYHNIDSKSGSTTTTTTAAAASNILFDNFEDEIYFQQAIGAILFKPPKSSCAIEYLCAIVIPINKLKICVHKIKTLINSE